MDIEVAEHHGYTLFTLAGKIDWENTRRLDDAIAGAIQNGTKRFVFDLCRVSFLCSGAIGSLTYNLKKVRTQGGAFHVISSNDHITEILQTLHFDAVVGGRLYRSFNEFREHVIAKDGGQA